MPIGRHARPWPAQLPHPASSPSMGATVVEATPPPPLPSTARGGGTPLRHSGSAGPHLPTPLRRQIWALRPLPRHHLPRRCPTWVQFAPLLVGVRLPRCCSAPGGFLLPYPAPPILLPPRPRLGCYARHGEEGRWRLGHTGSGRPTTRSHRGMEHEICDDVYHQGALFLLFFFEQQSIY